MIEEKPNFQKYLLVCENERPAGNDCCGTKGTAIREVLKEKVKSMGLSSKIRVSRTGCVDVCSKGPNVLLMPDNIWFNGVKIDDVQYILDKAAQGVK